VTQEGFDPGDSGARGRVAGAESGAETDRASAATKLDQPSQGGCEFGPVSEVDGAAVGFVFGLVANEVSNGVGGVEDGEEDP